MVTAAAELLKEWKTLTAAENATANGAAAPAVPASAKRVRETVSEAESKRAKSPTPAPAPAALLSSMEDDSSLDMAMNAAAVPRKASLKPDHMKARRPVQPLTPTVPPRRPTCGCSGGAPATAASIPGRPPAVIMPPANTPAPKQPSPTPTSFATSPPTTAPTSDGKPRKRVSWLSDSKGAVVCETKEYVVEAKEKHVQVADFQQGYLAERQNEKLAMQGHRDGSLDLSVQWGMMGSAQPHHHHQPHQPQPQPAGPVETIPWRTPPLLDQSLWPEVKGDQSAEREMQRERRARFPAARYQSLQDVPPTPHEPPEHEQLPRRDDRLTPIQQKHRACQGCQVQQTYK